jgi:S-adenosylmethionine decarboxylase proenzyme
LRPYRPMSPESSPGSVHLLVECLGCDARRLDDPETIERALRGAAAAIGARVLSAAFHRFSPQGVTGFLLLEESHVSVHSWPEQRYAAIDLFTCGATDPGAAVALLSAALGATRTEQLRVARGQLAGPRLLSCEGSERVPATPAA